MNTSFLHRTIVALVLGIVLWVSGAPAHAMIVTQLDLTGGSVQWDWRFSDKLDRLLDRAGVIEMGVYQPTPDIVPPVAKRHRTFSLFTSGVQGAPPPSATITGTHITVDLNSLFFGISRGDHLRAWNIGGVATGSFDPDTSAFCISWEHLFRDRPFLGPGTFTLQGKAQFAAVPLPASVGLFLSGLLCLGATAWRRRARFQPAVV